MTPAYEIKKTMGGIDIIDLNLNSLVVQIKTPLSQGTMDEYMSMRYILNKLLDSLTKKED